MELITQLQLAYSASGFVVGIIVGLTGVGGGALMTPILVLVFGLHPAKAVGTDLLFAAVTKGVGTVVHGVGKSIDWKVVGLLAAGSLPATLLTTTVLRRYAPDGAAMSDVLTRVLAYALLVTAASLLFRGHLQRLVRRAPASRHPNQRAFVTVFFGAALGVLVTLSSIGAGSIGVTVLVLLYPEIAVARIVGTDIAHAVPLTLVAGLAHLSLGTVDLGLLASLLAGSIPGVVIGSMMSPRLPEGALRMALAAILVTVSTMLLMK